MVIFSVWVKAFPCSKADALTEIKTKNKNGNLLKTVSHFRYTFQVLSQFYLDSLGGSGPVTVFLPLLCEMAHYTDDIRLSCKDLPLL